MGAINRRRFFYGALLAGAVPSGGFSSAPSLKALGYKSPNERLNIAAIGAGGRATANISGCATENFVAFADPDDASAASTYKKYEKAARYKDFRRMLDKESGNIDAVIVSTPDHVHAVAAYAAMERGKHVYVEKPLAKTVSEIRSLTHAVAKFKVATQMGNQGFSNEGARIAAEIIWSGEIGDVTEVHCWTDSPIWDQGMDRLPPEEKAPPTLDWDVWLGPAAARPYSSAYCPFTWRGWFDFGSGALGDVACHVWGAVYMALRLGPPSSIHVLKTTGKNPYTFPRQTVTEIQFPARGAFPPVKITWTDAARAPTYQPQAIPEGEPIVGGKGSFGSDGAPFANRPANAPRMTGYYARLRMTPDASGAIFVGSKGYLTTDIYGGNVRLLPESRHKAYHLPPQVLPRSPGHYQDWIRACKGVDPPACSNFAVSGPLAEIVQLASVAVHFDGKLEWDSANMRFTNNSAANVLLKPKYRKGWAIG